MRFQLVSNARDFWKWASVRLHVAATALAAALVLDPSAIAGFLELVPEHVRPLVLIAWLGLGILARVIKLSKPGAPEAQAGNPQDGEK